MNKANPTYIPDINGWISYYEKQAEAFVSTEKTGISCPSVSRKSDKDTRVIATSSDISVEDSATPTHPTDQEKDNTQQEQEQHKDPTPDIKSENMGGGMKLVSPVQSAVEQAKGIKKVKSGVKRKKPAQESGISKKSKKPKKTVTKKKAKRDIFNFTTAQ